MSHKAPDILTLYRFEDYIEPALVEYLETYLTQEGANITVYRQRETTEKSATPWIEVKLILGEETEHMYVATDGTQYPDAYTFQLQFSVVTNRTTTAVGESGQVDGEENGSLLRARVRVCMANFCKNLNDSEVSTKMHYHAFEKLMESGTSPEIDDGNNLDISRITYTGRLRIRPDAWPVDEYTG